MSGNQGEQPQERGPWDPVFIGGTGRSGTSFLFRMIRTTDGFYSFGDLESNFIIEVAGLMDLFHGLSVGYNASRSERSIQSFTQRMGRLRGGLEGSTYGDDGLDRYCREGAYVEVVERFIGTLRDGSVAAYADAETLLTRIGAFVRELAESIVEASPESRFVEKTPHNVLHLDFLHRLFPSAQFVHITRDPRAVAESLLRQRWGPNNWDDACRWIKHVLARFSSPPNQAAITPDNYLQIRLEDVVHDPERTSRELGRFLRSPSFSIDPNVIDASRLEAWRQHVTVEDRETCENMLAAEMAQFGYAAG